MSSIITPSQLILCHKYLQEVQAVMVNTSKLRVHTETQLQGHNRVNVGRKKTENQPVKAPGHQSSEIIRHHLGDWLVNTSFWICEGGTNLSNRTKSQFLCGITKKKIHSNSHKIQIYTPLGLKMKSQSAESSRTDRSSEQKLLLFSWYFSCKTIQQDWPVCPALTKVSSDLCVCQ